VDELRSEHRQASSQSLSNRAPVANRSQLGGLHTSIGMDSSTRRRSTSLLVFSTSMKTALREGRGGKEATGLLTATRLSFAGALDAGFDGGARFFGGFGAPFGFGAFAAGERFGTALLLAAGAFFLETDVAIESSMARIVAAVESRSLSPVNHGRELRPFAHERSRRRR
jgi:hypothetical protein